MTSVSDESLKLFPNSKGVPAAVVIVTHGLNNRPEVMNSIINLLNERNYFVIRVAFEGHLEGQSMENVTADAWLKDLESAYCIAKSKFADRKTSYLWSHH